MPNVRRSIKISEQEVESVLDKVVTEMIARDLGIKPEEVTPEFIHAWRENYLYPKAPVVLTTRYGGYNGAGRRVLSGIEVRSNQERADAFFRRWQ